ncbi:hypothetical protein GCM10009839_55960 [Catenulispora yoronensis]|uniref:ACT domain-containing protein n=1 Tax=Catenulispora yoronensis TaxID=450799 RepID=A0ABN2UWH7_9ACTN
MSALYPTPSPPATAWLATLRATLANLVGQVPGGPPVDPESLAAHVESAAPEAAEVGAEVLAETLREYGSTISGLTAAFGLRPAAIVVALGRGEELGELDPVVAQALDQVPELAALTSSGTVVIAKDGRATTLIAATTVGPALGPLRLDWPDRDDVWLCAVPSGAGPLAAARAALARILPQAGVPRSELRAVPDTHPQTLHVALRTVDPAADPELVMARLEGWRTAVEQLHRGDVAIHWEQA